MEQSKIKTYLVLFVSALWLLSITAPPILQLLDEDSPGITYTMSEEESKEQEKKVDAEETVFSVPAGISITLLSLYRENTGWKTDLSFGSHFQEIKLPPPEVNS